MAPLFKPKDRLTRTPRRGGVDHLKLSQDSPPANQPQPARKDCVFAWNNYSEASSATMHHSRVESRHQEMPDAVEHILQQARSPGQTEAFAWRIHFLDKRIQLNVMQPAGGNGRYGRIFSKVYWSQKGFQPPSTTKDGVCEAHCERGNVPEILQHSRLLPLPEEAYEFLDVQHLVFLAFSTLHLYYWFKNAPVEEECQSMTTSTLYQGICSRTLLPSTANCGEGEMPSGTALVPPESACEVPPQNFAYFQGWRACENDHWLRVIGMPRASQDAMRSSKKVERREGCSGRAAYLRAGNVLYMHRKLRRPLLGQFQLPMQIVGGDRGCIGIVVSLVAVASMKARGGSMTSYGQFLDSLRLAASVTKGDVLSIS
ncbi:hypothetical protein L207DRAFT_524560 [Hyaloscypha variabilis F]|uniref:Uncharacterized protein n=1 Tax=Hyaloscypha variabilis (strain UAMH 11265 / GT02V1 / F) TaxID=1149755 RepID=A0A2J6S313_HYAVF|nr:hypothetical protein L207DRAFT_524560 [Hyaloscypha variabilis F]